jgi:hypothetical protein
MYQSFIHIGSGQSYPVFPPSIAVIVTVVQIVIHIGSGQFFHVFPPCLAIDAHSHDFVANAE